ncbi:hypothetical protein DEI93_07140 [Curtobacterium sp. MCBD17_035]|uniref:hypothetical protein n=1 Tax=Curtobacterium sp. MCBD17_035 TaxID=2175673 RepID=UPI000DA869C8|nr:hypothetical protein [Curtobacterium sp. MCBD17_035]WIB68796.1 hypothetical protein DEI93_07140 [Curtobacterium sp. MCBD17_035]
MTELVQSGDFAVDVENRSVRGLLLPWGETSRLSASGEKPIAFPRGSVPAPTDPSYISVNIGHDRYQPVGRVTAIEDTDKGLVADFAIANTPEGDEFLDQHKAGTIRKLSAELTDIVRSGVNGVKARLTGAAFVSEGAFASAALFAVGDVRDDQTTDPAPAAPDTIPAEEPGDTQEDTVGDTQVPNTLDASRTGAPKPLNKHAMFALLNAAKAGQATGDQMELLRKQVGHTPEGALFALSDVIFDGTTAQHTGPASTMTVPQWLGEVYSSATKPYRPTYSDLFTSQNLTGLVVNGWRYTQALTGGDWAGNKTAIPSGNIAVAPVQVRASRFAGGADVAREYQDFALPGFFDDLFNQLALSYAKWKDQSIVGPAVVAAATAVAADNPAGLSIGSALSKVLDGAVAVAKSGSLPGFAIVGFDDYKQMLKTPQQDILGYLNAALGIDRGDLAGFAIRPSALITDGSVLVGTRTAATIFELGGAAPIRVQAPNIANGGIDIAVFGYAAALVTNTDELVKVTPYSAS